MKVFCLQIWNEKSIYCGCLLDYSFIATIWDERHSLIASNMLIRTPTLYISFVNSSNCITNVVMVPLPRDCKYFFENSPPLPHEIVNIFQGLLWRYYSPLCPLQKVHHWFWSFSSICIMKSEISKLLNLYLNMCLQPMVDIYACHIGIGLIDYPW